MHLLIKRSVQLGRISSRTTSPRCYVAFLVGSPAISITDRKRSLLMIITQKWIFKKILFNNFMNFRWTVHEHSSSCVHEWFMNWTWTGHELQMDKHVFVHEL